MNIRDRQGLKQAAAEHLKHAAYDPRKLTVLHGGVIVGIALVLSVLSAVLSQGIAGTGGLSGIGTRNLLQTVQSVLQLAYSVLTPFWQVGILFAFLSMIRRQPAQPQSLLRGFFRFGPVLRLLLVEGAILMGLGFATAYVSSFIAIGISPKLMALLEPVARAMMEDPYLDPTQMLMEIPPQELLSAMLPMLVIFAVLYFACAIFFGFRMRFSSYLVLDDPQVGAFVAIGRSFRMTRGNCGALIRLDLSFWLYYVLQALAVSLCYVELFLPESTPGGVWLPVILYAIYAIAILALDWCMRPMVEATYALAYDSLKNPLPVVK